MRKTFLKTFLCLVVSLFFVGCVEEEYGIISEPEDMESFEVEVFVSDIDTLPGFDVFNKRTEISRVAGADEHIVDGDKHDIYKTYIVENRYTAVGRVDELLALGNVDEVWPGNLIQGNSVRRGQLASIPIGSKRVPGRICLPVVSGQATVPLYKDIDTFSKTNVIDGINEILASYSGAFPANVSYVKREVHSGEEMNYFLNLGKTGIFEKEIKEFTNISWSDDKTRILVKLKQVYFSVTYEYPGLGEVFTADITKEDLLPYVGADNPPCYVSSVDYGRYFFLLYETSKAKPGSKFSKLEDIIDKIFNKDRKDDIGDEDKSVLLDPATKVTLFQLGGNANKGLETITGNPEKLRQFIVDGAVLSKDNVGAPISYRVHHLKNSRPVSICNEMDVNVKTKEYERKKKMNDDVEIEIKEIFSRGLIAGGKLPNVSHDSRLYVSNIRVHIKEDGKVIESLPVFNPHLWNVAAKGDTHRSYSHTFKLGKLGENTQKRIIMEFDVEYLAVRYANGGWFAGPNREGREKFHRMVEFAFNTQKEKWEAFYSTSSEGRSMNNLVLRASLNFCSIYFKLHFMFKANGIRY